MGDVWVWTIRDFRTLIKALDAKHPKYNILRKDLSEILNVALEEEMGIEISVSEYYDGDGKPPEASASSPGCTGR